MFGSQRMSVSSRRLRCSCGPPPTITDDFLHVFRHEAFNILVSELPVLHVHDVDFLFRRLRVMGTRLRPKAVFERRDDTTTIGVVLRVGAGDEEDIQRQTDAVTPNLDVPFFHQIEETDLKPFRQVR